MIYGLLGLAVVIAVIGIINTLGLSVLERTREIGLLRAVGLSRRKLRTMITLESVAIALLGAVLGLVLGLVIGVVLRKSLEDDLTELALPLDNLVIFLVVAVHLRRARGRRTRHPRVADEGARGHRDRVVHRVRALTRPAPRVLTDPGRGGTVDG